MNGSSNNNRNNSIGTDSAGRAPFISLADHSPHLLGEWDAEFNAPLTPEAVSYGSSKKVHWICSARGHHFMAMVKNRTRLGSGCPYCKGNAVMPGENDLATLRPDLALEWDEERNYPDLPSQFSLHSNRRFWWTCPCDPSHHWYASVNNRTNGSGCPFCDVRRPPMLRLV